ncbi:MAG: hypothetical protein P1P84_02675 [Deferrisomatales bacterium]|nr:hypothetical protein [Deferrisomatales bacterium]
MAIQYLLNTNTGGLFPKTPVLNAQPYLVPYDPTPEEARIGRKIVHPIVVGTGKPSPGPDLAAAEDPAVVTTEFVEEPTPEDPLAGVFPPVRTGTDPDAAAADPAPVRKPRKPRKG